MSALLTVQMGDQREWAGECWPRSFGVAAATPIENPREWQRLAAIRHLFDWLVTGQIVPHNPAASVRGPSHTAKKARRRCSMRPRCGGYWTASM